MSAGAQKRRVADRGTWHERLRGGGCLWQLNVCHSFAQANPLRYICDHLIYYISPIHPINTIVLSQTCLFWKKTHTYHLLEDFAQTHTYKEAELK